MVQLVEQQPLAFLVRLARGDVERNAHRPYRRAFLVKDAASTNQHPAGFPVRPEGPEFDFQVVAGGHILVDLAMVVLQVLGMDQGQEGLIRFQRIVRTKAEVGAEYR